MDRGASEMLGACSAMLVLFSPNDANEHVQSSGRTDEHINKTVMLLARLEIPASFEMSTRKTARVTGCPEHTSVPIPALFRSIFRV